MATGFRTGFNDYLGNVWDVNITDTWASTQDNALPSVISGGDGFRLKYQGSAEGIFDPIKSSSVKIDLIAEDSTDEAFILHPFENPVDNWYCIIFKDEVLYWWGYLTNKTPSIENAPYNKMISIEAIDTLSLMKQIKFWDYRVDLSKGALGIPNGINNEQKWKGDESLSFGNKSTIRLGYSYGHFASYFTLHNSNPTIVELIHSLLYDLDRSAGGDLTVWEHYSNYPNIYFPSGGNYNNARLGGMFGSVRVFIDPYIYEDFGTTTPELKRDISISEMLAHILELINARIFQQDGRYYVVQIENYGIGDSVAAGYVNAQSGRWPRYKYSRAAAADGTNFPLQPIDDATQYWDNDIPYNLETTNTDSPKIKSGGSFDYQENARIVQLSFETAATFMDPKQTFIDFELGDTSNASVSMSNYSAPKVKIPSVGGRMRFTHIGIAQWLRLNSRNYQWGFFKPMRYDNRGVADVFQQCIKARYEYGYGVRQKTTQSLAAISADEVNNFAALKSIDYDSKRWLWSGFEFIANSAEWDIEMEEIAPDRDITSNNEIRTIKPPEP